MMDHVPQPLEKQGLEPARLQNPGFGLRGLGFTWTLQCSSFFGFGMAFLVRTLIRATEKVTTLEGLGRGVGFRGLGLRGLGCRV